MSFDVAVALPALVEALDFAHVGFVVFRIIDGGTEKVYPNQSLMTSLGYTAE